MDLHSILVAIFVAILLFVVVPLALTVVLACMAGTSAKRSIGMSDWEDGHALSSFALILGALAVGFVLFLLFGGWEVLRPFISQGGPVMAMAVVVNQLPHWKLIGIRRSDFDAIHTYLISVEGGDEFGLWEVTMNPNKDHGYQAWQVKGQGGVTINGYTSNSPLCSIDSINQDLEPILKKVFQKGGVLNALLRGMARPRKAVKPQD